MNLYHLYGSKKNIFNGSQNLTKSRTFENKSQNT